jgi:putative two-component system response regulator
MIEAAEYANGSPSVAEAVGQSDFRPPQAPSSANTRAKIMVVDDEPTNVKLVQRFLELDGYERFVTTTDARRALQMARDEQPDCILLDLMMPHVSGLEILDKLRADPDLALIPVIFLTAVTDSAVRRDALQRGATDFLNKPIDPYELAPRVANVDGPTARWPTVLPEPPNIAITTRDSTCSAWADTRG